MTTQCDTTTAISILDVIDHRNKYSTQRMAVVDRMPECIFEREGNLLIGHDSGFFKFYGYETPSENWKAFGGSKFTITMSDGSTIEASGQWWSVSPKGWMELTYGLGVNTITNLEKCYVFTGGHYVDRDIVDEWLASNEPSNNYNKYRPGHKDFGKHKIVSPWE